MKKQKIYILSTGRVGTTFLHRFFTAYYPDFKITHQTKWSRVINIIGNMPGGAKFKAWLIHTAFKTLKNQDISVTTLDPLLSLPIAVLLDHKRVSNVKIIHLVRNPQSFANSFMSWKSSSLSKLVLHYLIPFWQPVGFLKGIGFFKWLRMSKYEKFCWIWNFKNSKFYGLGKKYDYHLVKMEDLTNPDSQEAWQKLIEFIDLPKTDIDYKSFVGKRVNKSRNLKNDAERTSHVKQKEICQHYCGSLADILGYKI